MGTLRRCPDYRQTVTDVPGLNCYLCARTVPWPRLTPQSTGAPNGGAAGFPSCCAPRRPVIANVGRHDMATLDDLAARLEIAGHLLNEASEASRDLPLEPVNTHIRAIGEAMASIFDVQRAVFALRPELEPAFLKEPSLFPEANRRLTVALGEAYRLVDDGKSAEAVAFLESFAATESSEVHKRIAMVEAERIAKGSPSRTSSVRRKSGCIAPAPTATSGDAEPSSSPALSATAQNAR